MIELDSGEIERIAGGHSGSSRKGRKSAWATFVGWDKLLLVFAVISLLSLLGALFVLLTPVLDAVLGFMGLHYTTWDEWNAWIMASDRGLMIGVLLGLIALLFALLARFRVRRNYSVFMEAGCPQCEENELIRVRRNRRDRVLGFFGLPVRRYSCRNCTWHGMRLAGYQHQNQNKEFDRSEAEQLDGSAIERFEQEMIESPEFSEELFPAAETQMHMESDAELAAQNDGVEFALVEENAELPEPISEIDEAADQEDSGSEAIVFMPHEQDAHEQDAHEDDAQEDGGHEDDNDSIAELDDADTEDKQVGEEPISEMDGQVDLLQSDVQVELADNEVGAVFEDADDDFARLCHEVALSKK